MATLFFLPDEYLLNNSGETWPEPITGRWFRQAQPTAPRFTEKILAMSIF
jgi:hypothetical protein